MNYILHLMIYFSIYGLLALSLNLVVGYCGLFSLSHAVLFATGAYSYTLLTLHDVPLIWTILSVLVIAISLSLLLSIPSWYLPGDFFMMVSIAVQTVLYSLFYNSFSANAPPGTLRNITNGPYGLNVPVREFFGLSGESVLEMCILTIIVTVFCAIVFFVIIKSPWGRMLLAIRDNALAASSLGKSVRKARVQAFAVASCMAAISGCLFAAYVRFVDPSIATLEESILIMAMVVVGGTGNFRGPIVGALILVLIPELLRFLDIPVQLSANLRLLIYGFALVVIAHWRPQGIAGIYRME